MILYSLLLGAAVLVQTFYTIINDYIGLQARFPLTRMSALDLIHTQRTIYLKPRGLIQCNSSTQSCPQVVT